MAKRDEVCVTKAGREKLGVKMLQDCLRVFGTQDNLLAEFEKIFEFLFPKATLSGLENGKSSPTADNLILMARFSAACHLRGKLFLSHPKTNQPFSYGELLQILTEELDPVTGEVIPFTNGLHLGSSDGGESL